VHTTEVVTHWRRTQLAAVVWARSGTHPGVAVVVPLVLDGGPTIALHYGQRALADELAAASDVRLVTGTCRDLDVETVTVARVTPHVVADPEGDTFAETGLLNQELAKHPPSRRRIESIILRREHWWFVPRLLVHLRDPRDEQLLPRADAVIAVADDDGCRVATCHLGARSPVEVAPAADQHLPDGPATVLEHGADLPDIEVPWERRWEGRVSAGRFEVQREDADAGPRDTALTLRERMRLERQLEKACRRGLRDAGLA
jgi:hypothetical protein